jgi:hypothetical protein
MNTPHTHPRATEINFVVNGTFRTGMLAENGARFVFSEVPAGSASVFPLVRSHFRGVHIGIWTDEITRT